jgi:tRNA/rRNA methyltransferase
MTPNICIVLVEPKGSLNIGSVCRAMFNFGLSELRLVNPAASHLNDEARRMAVRATPLLENAKIYTDLAQALSDCHFSMGTTRRFGKYRKGFMHPDSAAKHILPLASQAKCALVFGREDHGLTTEELDLCQRLLTIPTHDDLPSLNLAQAVTICLYELHKAKTSSQKSTRTARKLADGDKLELMMQHMRRTLNDLNFLDPQNPDHVLRSFRHIFGRAELNEREVQIMHGLWSQIDWLYNASGLKDKNT